MKLEIYKEIKSHPSLNKWSDVQEIFSSHAIRSKCIPLFCHPENMMAVKLRKVIQPMLSNLKFLRLMIKIYAILI